MTFENFANYHKVVTFMIYCPYAYHLDLQCNLWTVWLLLQLSSLLVALHVHMSINTYIWDHHTHYVLLNCPYGQTSSQLQYNLQKGWEGLPKRLVWYEVEEAELSTLNCESQAVFSRPYKCIANHKWLQCASIVGCTLKPGQIHIILLIHQYMYKRRNKK